MIDENKFYRFLDLIPTMSYAQLQALSSTLESVFAMNGDPNIEHRRLSFRCRQVTQLLQHRKAPTKKWTSFVEWADKSIGVNGVTSDTHESQAQANAVCQMIRRQGLGGDGKIFPTKVYSKEAV